VEAFSKKHGDTFDCAQCRRRAVATEPAAANGSGYN
ncbi:MAG: hypothetical protein QOI96_431, partial [Verrucomicrobiota bacterium]